MGLLRTTTRLPLFVLLAASLLMVAAAPSAQAETRSAGCGVGYIIFKGQRGVAPQILAMTSNTVYSNQAFAISTGTLGCHPEEPIVYSQSERLYFARANRDGLIHDMARAQGEYLETLAAGMGVVPDHRPAFRQLTQRHLPQLLVSGDGDGLLRTLDRLLADDPTLARYALNAG